MDKIPVNVYRDSDVNPSNLTKINQHFQGVIESLENRIEALESEIQNHETRITTLESP